MGQPKTIPQSMSQSHLRSLLGYNPKTGIFTWLVSRGRVKAGDTAGQIKDNGYIQIRIDGRMYYAQRLAFMWMIGRWPEPEADHENRMRADNVWGNLREATRSLNNAHRSSNRSADDRGVSRRHGVWRARIMKDRRQIELGKFLTKDEARAAYVTAAKQLFGEFARTS